MTRKAQSGLTLFELLVGLTIVSMLALLLGALGGKSFLLQRDATVGMRNQQDIAFALRHFSEDVRRAVGIVFSDAPTAKAFGLRIPSGETYTYVWYRFDAEALRRVEAKTSAMPQGFETWTDVVDAKEFKVLEGLFTYYTIAGAPVPAADANKRRKEIRRIDLEKLEVLALAGQDKRQIPTISATMREAARPVGFVAAQKSVSWHNNSEKNPMLKDVILVNKGEEALTVTSIDVAFVPVNPSMRDLSYKLDKLFVPVPVGQTLEVEKLQPKFDDKIDLETSIHRIDLKLHTSNGEVHEVSLNVTYN